MKIYEIQERTPQLLASLLDIWEKSVRATHLFLSDAEIDQIKDYVPQAVGFYEHMSFVTYKRTEHDEQGNPYPLLYMKLALRIFHISCIYRGNWQMAMTDAKYKDLSIKEFTKAAAVYEGDHAGVYELCKKDYPDILEELEKEEFTDLLDAGCGPAPMISLLAEKYPDKHYTGLDLTPAMIEQAKKKNIPNAMFVVGDCENFPFEDNAFDAIICSIWMFSRLTSRDTTEPSSEQPYAPPRTNL